MDMGMWMAHWCGCPWVGVCVCCCRQSIKWARQVLSIVKEEKKFCDKKAILSII